VHSGVCAALLWRPLAYLVKHAARLHFEDVCALYSPAPALFLPVQEAEEDLRLVVHGRLLAAASIDPATVCSVSRGLRLLRLLCLLAVLRWPVLLRRPVLRLPLLSLIALRHFSLGRMPHL
jgi:hypothetical protein